jgi:hypothetical protein
VAEWATQWSCADVCRFVGLANYYRKFVLRFSALAAPLTALCSPSTRFAWGDAEQRSFDALKAALMSAPVLRVWDPARPAGADGHGSAGASTVMTSRGRAIDWSRASHTRRAPDAPAH